MKMLLTDAGIRNASIEAALVELLGKPIEESMALDVPTALHPGPNGGRRARWSQGSRTESIHAPSLEVRRVVGTCRAAERGRERWEPVLRASTAARRGRRRAVPRALDAGVGCAELLPELENLTYVGLSAGSMVMTPSIGKAFKSWESPDGGDETLGFVPFSLCPHVAFDGGEGNPIEVCEKWASLIGRRAYLTDSDTAIKVVDGVEEVVSEGTWRLVNE